MLTLAAPALAGVGAACYYGADYERKRRNEGTALRICARMLALCHFPAAARL